MTEEFAKHFAAEWIDAWNSRDLDKILEHYADDFTIETPMAIKIKPETNGVVAGKPKVREYWKQGLKLIPSLHFELIDVLTGINGLTIYYRNTATGRKTTEVIFFNAQQKVEKAYAMYSWCLVGNLGLDNSVLFKEDLDPVYSGAPHFGNTVQDSLILL